MALEFKRDGTPFVLKITPKSRDNPTEAKRLEEKLDFIDFLAEGIQTIARNNPEFIATVLRPLVQACASAVKE